VAHYRGIWNHGGYPLPVVWRGLTWKEYKQITARYGEPRLRQVTAYQACLVEGPALEAAPAGIVAWIGRQQIDESPFTGGFKVLQKTLARERERLGSSALEAAKSVIAWAFRYTLEEIDNWPAELLLERWARAEYVLGAKLDPQDPNAPPPTAADEARKPPRRPRGLGQKAGQREGPSQETQVNQFRR
jgi:hypothetical protein